MACVELRVQLALQQLSTQNGTAAMKQIWFFTKWWYVRFKIIYPSIKKMNQTQDEKTAAYRSLYFSTWAVRVEITYNR